MIQKSKVFNLTVKIDGEEMQGTFTVKRLGVMDQMRMNTRMAQLCGGMHPVIEDGKDTGKGVDLGTAGLAHTIAFLEVAISDAPEWWDLKTISDSDAVNAVYNEVSDFALSFLSGRRNADPQAPEGSARGVVQPDDGGGAAGGGAERPLPVEAGRPAAVVVRQVQASLDV